MRAVLQTTEATLAGKLRLVLPHLDERQRRLLLAAEARTLGRGGIRFVARAVGVTEATVSRGVSELESGEEPLGRARRRGAGRKRIADHDPRVRFALSALIEPQEPESAAAFLHWTTRSTRALAQELARQGVQISADTVADLLREQGFSLRGSVRSVPGGRQPDRDAQFRYLNQQAISHHAAGNPVVVAQTHRRTTARGDGPEARRVDVGIDQDTVTFAVDLVRRWWLGHGRQAYPAARGMLVVADAGGSDDVRTRTWRIALGNLATETNLALTVCHQPPGTYLWTAYRQRMRGEITANQSGPSQPETTHEIAIGTVEPTAGGRARRFRAPDIELRTADAPVTGLHVEHHEFRGDWNYTLWPGTGAQ
jgi:transposase